MKFLLFIPFLLIFNLSLSQVKPEKLSFELKSKMAENKLNDRIELVFVSRNRTIETELAQLKISFEKYFESHYRIRANWDQIIELSKSEHIDYIESGFGNVSLLNDTMRSLNFVNPVHRGDAPLVRSYKGKDVVVGFIDTGIDFTHPDFIDSSGKTRVLFIWDQAADTLVSSRIPSFGYGQVWDSSDINSNACPHDDDVLSHGTNVAGIACGNGGAIDMFEGVAPESDIIVVASDFSSSNWLQNVADGVEYIFAQAESLGKPCVINISAGQYLGSHDGTDLAAMRIDNLIKAKRGRALVAAAGNSGNIPYHLGAVVSSDTGFTWFAYNPNTLLNYGAVYFQLWADTAEFNQVHFSVGANLKSGSFADRGQTSFDVVANRLNVLVRDSIVNNGFVLAYVETYVALQGDKYFMEVHLKQPDSSQYLYRFNTTGYGHFNIWSDSWLGTSHIYKGPLPSVSVYPAIVHYQKPDSLQTIVSSFTCLPSVLTVANYVNKNAYLDYDSVWQTFPVIPGKRAANSSLGPNRRNMVKPDIAASGDYTLTSNRLASIPLHIANNQSNRIAKGGFHKRNGGTSMAAPVVAGTLALMLEQCPESDFNSLKNHLIGAAYQDSFTGAFLPNYAYGYGKTHAYHSLTSQLKKPVVTKISANRLQSSIAETYQWYLGDSMLNGETARTLTVSVDGAYRVEVSDSNRCSSFSDPLDVYLGVEADEDHALPFLAPNPSLNRVVRIVSTEKTYSTFYTLDLAGIQGNTVFTQIVRTGSEIDLTKLKSGVYFYTLTSKKNERITGKLILN